MQKSKGSSSVLTGMPSKVSSTSPPLEIMACLEKIPSVLLLQAHLLSQPSLRDLGSRLLTSDDEPLLMPR